MAFWGKSPDFTPGFVFKVFGANMAIGLLSFLLMYLVAGDSIRRLSNQIKKDSSPP